jgi:dipeptidyl aminopeptidase/acylaminoacyl peptidase
METRIGSLSGSSPRFLVKENARYALPNRLLFARGSTLLSQAFDPGKAAMLGAPASVVSGVLVGGNALLSASENGVLMFQRDVGAAILDLTWCDRTGRKLGTVGATDQYSNPAISPDGKRLAVGIGEVTAHTRDIWVYDLERGGRYRLTYDPADDFNPVWSPDGRYIAFSSNRRGKRDIYRKLASGTGDEELLYGSATEDKAVESWSPDGKFLWFNLTDPKNRADIYQLSLDDRKVAKYISTPFDEDHAQLSPDGRWLAYHSLESSHEEVYLQPYPATGERWQVSTAGGTEPQWRGDGKELFFMAGNALTAVDIKVTGKSVQIGIPHPLFEAKIPVISLRNRYVPTKDGQKFLVIWQQEQQATGFDTIVNWTELIKGK